MSHSLTRCQLLTFPLHFTPCIFSLPTHLTAHPLPAAAPRNPMDLLPASLWHRVFRCLLLPPGSSHPDTPLVRGREKTPWYLTATSQPPAGRNLPMKFVDPDFSAAGQHRKNVKSYGSGWALLCCAMASKKLLILVLSFSVSAALPAQHPISLVYNDLHPQVPRLTYTHIVLLPHFHSLSSIRTHPSLHAQHPIALVYNDLHPQWERSVAFFLHWRGLRSLALTYTHIMQLHTLCSQDQWQFSSLTSLSLKLRGCVDSAQQFDTVEQGVRDEVEEEYWTQYLDCPRLQRLKLGRGKWVLQNSWADEFKALRSLTLKHVDWSYVDFNLTLFLTLSRSLKAFSAVAKRLVLSCKSSAPLCLDHLSLYGQERLVISSLRLALARVAYLNGPPRDWHSRDDACSSHWVTPAPSPDWQSSHRSSSPESSWVPWLGAIARTVEVLIVRHGLPVEQVGGEWSCLRSLGIVVESEEQFEVDWEVEKCEDDGEKEVTVEEFQERNQRQRILQQQQQQQRQQQQQQPWRQQAEQEEEDGEEEEGVQAGKPPLIRAPNLQAIFVPTRTCEQHTLASLRESCPSLALYCIACRSFYWEKHGKELTEIPVVHVRKGRSGVSSNGFGEKRPKNVREKMQSVSRELVEGYTVDKDEAYMLKFKGAIWRGYCFYGV
ncbi:unnamed protein product [Closterium sp. Yama58-4]|nr:unnamed protein product [Closterium sp. Yama58-4]